MQFRLADKTEREVVFDLYQTVIGREFCTWNQYYPGVEEIDQDLSTDNLFVLEDQGQIVGAISIVPENEYDDRACWKTGYKAAEFARVSIRSDYQGKGLSRLLVEGVMDEFRRRGVEAIHISVAKVNIPAQKLYRSIGFDFVDECFMYGNDFYLGELIL